MRLKGGWGDARAGGARSGSRFLRAHWARWVAALLVVVLGLAVSLGVAFWFKLDQEREDQARLADDGRVLVEAIEATSAGLETRMAAVAGLFRASGEVSADEFAQFTTDIGLTGGMGGYGFAPLVPDEVFRSWEAQVVGGDPDFSTFGIDRAGARLPLAEQQLHAPLLYFSPPEAFGVPPQGLDLMSEPVRTATLEKALRSGSMVVTPFLRLLGETDSDGLVAFMPVVAVNGSVLGFITAPVDLSLLLSATVPESLTERLSWQIVDPLASRSVGLLDVSTQPSWTTGTTFGDRPWLLTVGTRQPVVRSGPVALPWVTVPVGIVGSLLCGLVVFLIAGARDSRRKRFELQGAIRAKDRFLATISHELRTPLTSVVGFLHELSHRSDIDEAERRELLALAVDQADEMARIVEDLITAAKADTPELTTRVRLTDVSSEVAQALRAFPQPVGVRIDGPRGSTLAWADPDRLRQILRNLLNNAVRHGRPPIDLTITTGLQHLQIHVSDHGSGIPSEERSRLFRPYQPLSSSPGQPSSLGLGLWVSRLLARLMGGDLAYHPDPTPTFTVTLVAAGEPGQPHHPGSDAAVTPSLIGG